jgi:hypothetical protein
VSGSQLLIGRFSVQSAFADRMFQQPRGPGGQGPLQLVLILQLVDADWLDLPDTEQQVGGEEQEGARDRRQSEAQRPSGLGTPGYQPQAEQCHAQHHARQAGIVGQRLLVAHE